ncbi:MAG TPA: cobalamin-binding protein [Anaerolineae bacterium]|nr:cobalamin-binding protein [Anaerolineae bacterium]
MKRLTLWLLLVAALTLAACGADTSNTSPIEPTTSPAIEVTIAPTTEPTAQPAWPQTFTDSLGHDITLDTPAAKIVSLAPSNTEMLFAIDAGSAVVARDTFSDYPEAALALPDVGGGFTELNNELILSLEPDLILAADITPPEQVQALQDLGLNVYTLSNPTTLEEMYDRLRTLAQITATEDQTEQLITNLQARVAAVADKIATVEEKPLVFYELDATEPNAPWTAGPDTFIDHLITRAGGQNVGASLDSAWVQISIEELLVQDPDIILLGDAVWGGVTPESVAAREGWESLTAVQNDQVHTFDDNLASRPGPRLIDGLESMAQILHPDLFQ